MLRTVKLCTLSLFCLAFCHIAGDITPAVAADESKNSVFIAPEEAAENSDFKIQGEYKKEGQGIQVVALGKDDFPVRHLWWRFTRSRLGLENETSD